MHGAAMADVATNNKPTMTIAVSTENERYSLQVE